MVEGARSSIEFRLLHQEGADQRRAVSEGKQQIQRRRIVPLGVRRCHEIEDHLPQLVLRQGLRRRSRRGHGFHSAVDHNFCGFAHKSSLPAASNIVVGNWWCLALAVRPLSRSLSEELRIRDHL